MRKLGFRDAALVGCLVLVLVLMLLWFLGVPRDNGPIGAGSPDKDREALGSTSSFTITGDLTRVLRPGVMVPLDLSLDNPNDVDLTVDKIKVSLRNIDAPEPPPTVPAPPPTSSCGSSVEVSPPCGSRPRARRS